MRYLWEWYNEAFSGQRLTYLELEAWARMTGTRPTGWEVEQMMALDATFWKVQADDRSSTSTAPR